MRPKVALKRTGVETNITKGSQTNSQTDKTNRFGAKDLGRLEGPFEGVKHGDVADLRRESVPESGGCHTEGSVPEGSQVGAGGQSLKTAGSGVGHVGIVLI